MKIFIGNGPWYRPGYYGVRAGSRWPHFETECSPYLPFPFYMAYATALLQRDGFDVFTIDGIAERMTEEEYLRRVGDYQPDLVILEVSTPSMETDLRQADAIRKQCPQTKIVFAGLHLLGQEAEAGLALEGQPPTEVDIEEVVDFTLRGEYDYTVLELAQTLREGGSLAQVKGLSYRVGAVREPALPVESSTGRALAHDNKGSFLHNERREVIKDLDALPWPSREMYPMFSYHDLPGGIPAPSLQMWASRGCPFRCIFCVWPQVMYEGNLYNTRNPIDVVDEVEYCVRHWGFKSFYFDDDTFNIGKRRLLKLGEEISKRNLGIPWAAMARADTCDKETLRELKRSGLQAVKYGVESASQELVDNADKSLDLNKVEEMVRYTQELGIKIHLTFSFGLPGETHETARKTIKWSQKLNPDSIQYSIMTPFPGSKFYKELEAKGHLTTRDWSKYDGNSMSVIRTDALTSQDLDYYLRKAYQSWEWHKFRRALYQPRYIRSAWSHPLQSLRQFQFGLRAAARG